MWVDYFDYHLAEIDGNIIIRGRDPESGKLIFYAPCGPMDIGYFCSLVSDYCAEHDERPSSFPPKNVILLTISTSKRAITSA